MHIYPEKVWLSDVLYVNPVVRRGRQERHKEAPSAGLMPREPADLVTNSSALEIFRSRSFS